MLALSLKKTTNHEFCFYFTAGHMAAFGWNLQGYLSSETKTHPAVLSLAAGMCLCHFPKFLLCELGRRSRPPPSSPVYEAQFPTFAFLK